MSRRWFFTLDEALAEVLNEEDDFLFGAGCDESSDERDEEVQDGTCPSPSRSADVWQSDSDVDSPDSALELSSSHFLDEQADVEVAARRFASLAIDTDDDKENRCEDDDSREKPAVLGRGSQLIRCGCEQNCLKRFDAGEIEAHRLNILDLERTEKEALVLGVLGSCCFAETSTAKGKNRRRSAYAYQFGGRRVCVGTFQYVYCLGQKEYRNLCTHLEENGPIPRVHGNSGRKPHHALRFEQVRFAVQFVHNHAQRYGIPHPAPLRGRAEDPPVFLPASQNFKAVHKLYVASCQEVNIRSMAITAFRSVWHQCLPSVRFMTPRTDVCDRCERFRRQVASAVSEEEKTAALGAFSNHLQHAQKE